MHKAISLRGPSKFFRVMVQHKHTAWPSYIEIIQNIINEVYQETTGFTPMEIQLGKKPTRFWQKYISSSNKVNDLSHNEKLFLAESRIKSKRMKANEKVNKSRNVIKFKIQDKVLLKDNNISSKENKQIAKFFEIYSGPNCEHIQVSANRQNL